MDEETLMRAYRVDPASVPKASGPPADGSIPCATPMCRSRVEPGGGSIFCHDCRVKWQALRPMLDG